MISDDSNVIMGSIQPTSLGYVISEAADRVASLETCPTFGLSTLIDNAVWESLLYHMAADPLVAAELAAEYHFDPSVKVPISAVLQGLRRSEAMISPIQELSLAMSVASFLYQAREWVRAELRERGCLLPEIVR